MEHQLITFVERNNLHDASRVTKLGPFSRLFNPVSGKKEELYQGNKMRSDFKLLLDSFYFENKNEVIKSKLDILLQKKKPLESITEETQENTRDLVPIRDEELKKFNKGEITLSREQIQEFIDLNKLETGMIPTLLTVPGKIKKINRNKALLINLYNVSKEILKNETSKTNEK